MNFRRILFQVITAAAALIYLSCSNGGGGGGSAPSDMSAVQVAPGTWGGPHAQLTTSQTNVAMIFDCARGNVNQRLTTDVNGDFDMSGTLTSTSPEFAPTILTARFFGQITGNTMTLNLSYTLDGKSVTETYTLMAGVAGRIFACTNPIRPGVSPTPAPSATPAEVAQGRWAQDHVALDVTATGGKIEFDCAHGTLAAPLLTDPTGHFDVSGNFVPEGGPDRPDRPVFVARYSGQVVGNTMNLHVRVFDGTNNASDWVLIFGAQPHFTKCL